MTVDAPPTGPSPRGRARAAGARADYREIRSTKGHDAFLVEWDQLTDLIGEVLAG